MIRREALATVPAMTNLRRSLTLLLLSSALAVVGCKNKNKGTAQTGSAAAGSAETGSAGSAEMGSAGSAGSAEMGSAGSAEMGSAGSAAAGSAASAGSAAENATAVAEIKATKGHKVAGTVTFTQEGDKTTIAVDLTGLKPGKHGFHIHETGDCSAPDAKSAGGHFNPTKQPHGAPNAAKHHAGDLGNLSADKKGHVKVTLTTTDLTVADGPSSVVGKAVIVHGKADDLKSQPAGNSGPRVGCGVIEKK